MSRFKYEICKFCGLKFMPVSYIPCRQQGYCTEGCMAHEKRTEPSEVSIAYKNGFRLKNRG